MSRATLERIKRAAKRTFAAVAITGAGLLAGCDDRGPLGAALPDPVAVLEADAAPGVIESSYRSEPNGRPSTVTASHEVRSLETPAVDVSPHLVEPGDDAPNGPRSWIHGRDLSFMPRLRQMGNWCFYQVRDNGSVVNSGWRYAGSDHGGVDTLWEINAVRKRRYTARVRCSQMQRDGTLIWSWWGYARRKSDPPPPPRPVPPPEPIVEDSEPGVENIRFVHGRSAATSYGGQSSHGYWTWDPWVPKDDQPDADGYRVKVGSSGITGSVYQTRWREDWLVGGQTPNAYVNFCVRPIDTMGSEIDAAKWKCAHDGDGPVYEGPFEFRVTAQGTDYTFNDGDSYEFLNGAYVVVENAACRIVGPHGLKSSMNAPSRNTGHRGDTWTCSNDGRTLTLTFD